MSRTTTPLPCRSQRRAALFAIAGRQRNLVRTSQLGPIGFGGSSILAMVDSGRLFPLRRAVYSVGPPMPDQITGWWALALSASETTALGFRAAAKTAGFSRLHVSHVDLVSRGEHAVPVSALSHQCKSIAPRDIQRVDGVLITSPARTLLDIAGVETAYVVANLLHQALHRRRVTVAQVRDVIWRFHGHHGRATLERALVLHGAGSAGSRSGLEDAVIELLERAGIQAPLVNVRRRIGGRPVEPDLAWTDLRVSVEVDGPGHDLPEQQAADREHDEHMARNGWIVLRVHHLEIRRGDHRWLSELRGILDARRIDHALDRTR